MDLLDWECPGPQRDHLHLRADLDHGWTLLAKGNKKQAYRGFDLQIYLPDRSEPKYWCHLYVVARVPIEHESVETFAGTHFKGTLGCNQVSINGSIMEIDVPLELNTWAPTKESGRMGIYASSEELFRINTEDGNISFRAQLWLVNYEPKTMFIKHQYEWGDGFAWIGGRPESNRRKH
jgi:hypothetical protein